MPPIDMKTNLRILCAAFGLAVFGLTGCETVEETPTVTTTTQTTEVTEVQRPVTRTVIRED